MSREDWLDCPDPEGDRIEAQERRDRESEKAPLYDYAYRCHSCRGLVDVEEVQRHIEAHKADPEWDGTIFLEREDHAAR